MRAGQLGDTRGVVVGPVIRQLCFDTANFPLQLVDPIFDSWG